MKAKTKNQKVRRIKKILKELEEANEVLDSYASEELLNSLDEVRYHADLAYRQWAYIDESVEDLQNNPDGGPYVLH